MSSLSFLLAMQMGPTRKVTLIVARVLFGLGPNAADDDVSYCCETLG
jgi:hypothetical protein